MLRTSACLTAMLLVAGSLHKTKLATCRKEVKSKGLAGDDRRFYIEDCMGKT